jgi:hypothetical protein
MTQKDSLLDGMQAIDEEVNERDCSDDTYFREASKELGQMSYEIREAKQIIDTQLKHLSAIGSKVKMKIET